MSHTSQLAVERVTIPVLQRRKEEGRAIVMITAYDAGNGTHPDPVVDVILVGDSVGNVCLGFDDHFTGQHGDDESPPGRGRTNRAWR